MLIRFVLMLAVLLPAVKMDLMDALIQAESSGDPNAFNKKSGARGLTQITSIAWQDLVAHYPAKYENLQYTKDIFNPKIARQAGEDYIRIIKGYLKHYKLPETTENILASYNFGIGNVRANKPLPEETRNYITKILALMKK